MKKVLLSVITMLITMMCVSQNPLPRSYHYDEAGNRVLRATLIMKVAIANSDNAEILTTDTFQSLYYEEFIGEISVRVFPNPTHGIVTLQFSQPVESGRYQLCGMSGRMLSEGTIESATSIINLSDYQR